MNQQDTDYHDRIRAMLERVKRENERRFNEQVSDIQRETNSTEAEMVDTLHELGLHDEARRYRAYTYKKHADRAKAAARRPSIAVTLAQGREQALQELKEFLARVDQPPADKTQGDNK